MSLSRAIAGTVFFLFLQVAFLLLLRGPGAPKVPSDQLQWQWVHPVTNEGLRFSAKFQAPVEARLVLYMDGFQNQPVWQTPYQKAEAKRLYVVSVHLPLPMMPESCRYRWEIKDDSTIPGRTLAKQVNESRVWNGLNL